jgi:hypothetical protein
MNILKSPSLLFVLLCTLHAKIYVFSCLVKLMWGIRLHYMTIYFNYLSGPTLIGILPYAGLKFYIYEDLKSRVPEVYKRSVILKLSCGALAGLFGQTLTYPLDVVRRQMQV